MMQLQLLLSTNNASIMHKENLDSALLSYFDYSRVALEVQDIYMLRFMTEILSILIPNPTQKLRIQLQLWHFIIQYALLLNILKDKTIKLHQILQYFHIDM